MRVDEVKAQPIPAERAFVMEPRLAKNDSLDLEPPQGPDDLRREVRCQEVPGARRT
jgi:hypothetical protein